MKKKSVPWANVTDPMAGGGGVGRLQTVAEEMVYGASNRDLYNAKTSAMAQIGTSAPGRRPKLVALGVSPKVIQSAHPQYKNALLNANKLLNQRQRELYSMFGFVSAGVSHILASAHLALAASRFLLELAMEESGKKGPGGKHLINQERIVMAAKLAAEARLNEEKAYELCQKESKQRRHLLEASTPWEASNAITAEGEDKEAWELEEAESGVTPLAEQKP